MTAARQLAALAELDEALSARGIDYWLFGGWAVDFHVGRVTREHADIDIAVWASDTARLRDLLLDSGWAHSHDAVEEGYTCYQRLDVQLEVAFLALDESGFVYTPIHQGRADWPANSFGDDVRRLGDVAAHVISRASLVAEKSVSRDDAVTSAKDRVDLAALERKRSPP